MSIRWIALAGALALLACYIRTYDPSYVPDVPDPVYPAGNGTRVIFDEAHDNVHSLDGTYRPFRDLLLADGYQPEVRSDPITSAADLAGAIFVSALPKHGLTTL